MSESKEFKTLPLWSLLLPLLIILGVMLILTFVVIEPRYESLVDEMPCENAETYLDREDGGWIIQHLIGEKLIECNR